MSIRAFILAMVLAAACLAVFLASALVFLRA